MGETPSLAKRITVARRWLRRVLWTINPIGFLARQFIRRAAARSGATCSVILDVGCGNGPYRRELMRSFAGRQYLGIDISITEETSVVADARRLPMKGNCVDLAGSFDVIQHIPEPNLMLDEIVRVIRPGGLLILSFPFLYGECDVHDFQRWTMEGLRDLLERRAMEVLTAHRRGGYAFTIACAINRAIQHIIPGSRRSWRAADSRFGLVRSLVISCITVPSTLLMWFGLFLDCALPTTGAYMGGIILARKQGMDTTGS